MQEGVIPVISVTLVNIYISLIFEKIIYDNAEIRLVEFISFHLKIEIKSARTG